MLLLNCFRLCQSHMEARMEPSNVIGLYYWARDLGATSLADLALRYLCQHFTQVGKICTRVRCMKCYLDA